MPADDVFPMLIPPMIAAAGTMPGGPGWSFEFKFDGVRAIAYAEGDRHLLLSRNDNDVTATYRELGELPAVLGGRSAVLDGEIVALEPGDRPSFARLQQRMHVADPTPALVEAVPVVYYVFDLLRLDGVTLLDRPYHERRALLTGLELAGEHVAVPAAFPEGDGGTVLKAAELAGLEGVVAKRLASPYRPGRRSPDWTKVALIKTQEVLVVGWKPGEGRRAGTIGSLLLAVYDRADRLAYAGHVGTGFSDATLRLLHDQLKPLARSTPPLPVPRDHARHAHWVEPVLVGEVAFRTWTPDNRLRHAVWRGLRSDRPGHSVRRAPTPVPPPSPDVVEGAFETPDGAWRVEVVRRGDQHFYRLIHGDNVVEGLDIEAVERSLAELGLGMDQLRAAA